MKSSIAIAVSGGIDSLVAAHLLLEKGHKVFGIHFLTGYEQDDSTGAVAAEAVCRQLDLPLTVLDLKDDFRRQVVDYFADAYRRGLTPNPCMVCNPEIKFGILLEKARQMGASHLATGHYARVEKVADGRYGLDKGVDAAKDQSYFLARLTQAQLAGVQFPLGTWTKAQVRQLAQEKGLAAATASESQDVCFIADGNYADFLIDSLGIKPRPGPIVDTRGRVVGTHQGLHRYTVGQRRGINCPASQPYYVVQIDAAGNRLVVGFKEEGLARGCLVTDVNWITLPPKGPLDVHTRIRYRHQAVASTLIQEPDGRVTVAFNDPQAAVTPGQGAVFYRGDAVLGGGWIAAGE